MIFSFRNCMSDCLNKNWLKSTLTMQMGLTVFQKSKNSLLLLVKSFLSTKPACWTHSVFYRHLLFLHHTFDIFGISLNFCRTFLIPAIAPGALLTYRSFSHQNAHQFSNLIKCYPENCFQLNNIFPHYPFEPLVN